jgi:hypothetical protein
MSKTRVSIAEIESLFDRPVVILPDKENAQGDSYEKNYPDI